MARNLLVISLILGLASSAAAHVVIVPVVPFGPYPTYYYPPPEHLECNNQYYDFSLHGLQRLCRMQPELCSADQRDQLQSLETRRDIGMAMVFTGVAAAIVGPLWTAFSAQHDATGVHGNAVPLVVGLGAGLTLPLAGGIVMPHRSELVDFVNDVNAQHPETPIRLNIGGVMTPLGTPGVAVGLNF